MLSVALLDVVGRYVDDSEYQHSICYLAMQVNVLIHRYELDLGSNES